MRCKFVEWLIKDLFEVLLAFPFAPCSFLYNSMYAFCLDGVFSLL
jgi:hypothetical protein